MTRTTENPVRGELYHDTGVVLRTYKLRESDRIVVLMTERHGKVRAVAKGVRKTRSKFGSRLEPMSHVRVLMWRGAELDIVNQADSVEPLSPLLNSLDRTSQGLAAVEAIDLVALDREPNPQLYRMLVGVLRTIGRQWSAMTIPAFYLKLLAAEGVAPQLDACVRCGEDASVTDLVSLDLAEGGVLCRQCRSGATISPDALRLMRMALGGELKSVLELPESAAAHEVSVHAIRAMEHHVERSLKTAASFERT